MFIFWHSGGWHRVFWYVLVCRRNTEVHSDTFINSYQTTPWCYMTQNHGRTRLVFSDNNWLLNANLSLFLIKPTLWKHMGRSGTAPRFLTLDIRWLWLVSFSPPSLYSRETDLIYRSMGLWGEGGRTVLVTPLKRNIFLMPGLYHWLNGR
jgi:hypothetical protein